MEILRRLLEIDSGFHSQGAQLRQLLKRLMGPKAPSELAHVPHMFLSTACTLSHLPGQDCLNSPDPGKLFLH